MSVKGILCDQKNINDSNLIEHYEGSSITISTKSSDILIPSWKGHSEMQQATWWPKPITEVPFSATITNQSGQSKSISLGISGHSIPSGIHDTYDGTTGVCTLNIGKLVLTGSEEGFTWTTNLGGRGVRAILYYLPQSGVNMTDDILCTHFQPSTNYQSNNRICYITNHGTQLVIRADDEFSTFEEAKTYIAGQYNNGTPITLYYQLLTPIIFNKSLDTTAFDGTTTILGANSIDLIKDKKVFLNDIIVSDILPNNGSGVHNSIYRGNYIGNTVTAEQQEAIANGTFKNLFIGDYWIINNITWRIAAFNYYLKQGNTYCRFPHLLIVPDQTLYRAQMNTTDTTVGGYVSSEMYKNNLSKAIELIKSQFQRVLNNEKHLVNAVTNGRPSATAWYNREVDLMNEQMLYGNAIFCPGSNGVEISKNYRTDKSQLPLFVYRPDLIGNNYSFWLRDIANDESFVFMASNGNTNYNKASVELGVRPYFCIY